MKAAPGKGRNMHADGEINEMFGFQAKQMDSNSVKKIPSVYFD